MANNSISLTSLDFDSLKSNFQDYLTSQSVFKDYNFTGSNMNVLLDVMSYNTYLNAFYLNMVASEMFLDSAVKLDSVVSHAKELNYVPKSARSAVASVTFNVTSDHSPVAVPKGTLFTGQNSNGSFTFTTAINQNFTSTPQLPNVYQIDLQIYEGFYLQDSFVMDYTQEQQKFVLTNQNIDTNSLTVTVIESGVNTFFTSVDTTFGVNGNSNVFFLQAAQNNQYEIIFGDGLIGRKPKNLSTIVADYRVTNGDAAQNISSFLLTSNLGPGIVPGTLTTVANAVSGSTAESIESIRTLAPRYFATQQRAVASDDYASLILSQFQGQLQYVNVYGGQNLEPKQYGRVAVCLKPSGGTITPNYIKDEVLTYLQDLIGLPTRVIITDPDYMYISVTTEVQYNVTGTTKYANEIKALLNDTIKQYSLDNIERFNGDFRYSKFVSYIDNADPSITSNNTDVKIIKRISPLLNYKASFVLDYNNPTEAENNDINLGYVRGKPFYDEPIITSSSFTYVDNSGKQWENCFIRDDNYGVLVVYKIIDGKFVVINDYIGNVNYNKGIVKITDIKTSNYGNYISIMIVPKNKDIIVSRDKILVIELTDVNVTVIPTQK